MYVYISLRVLELLQFLLELGSTGVVNDDPLWKTNISQKNKTQTKKAQQCAIAFIRGMNS